MEITRLLGEKMKEMATDANILAGANNRSSCVADGNARQRVNSLELYQHSYIWEFETNCLSAEIVSVMKRQNINFQMRWKLLIGNLELVMSWSLENGEYYQKLGVEKHIMTFILLRLHL
jgi:hypothetical protein